MPLAYIYKVGKHGTWKTRLENQLPPLFPTFEKTFLDRPSTTLPSSVLSSFSITGLHIRVDFTNGSRTLYDHCFLLKIISPLLAFLALPTSAR